nr:pseudouridine synthase [uncultured Bilophila sp.]
MNYGKRILIAADQLVNAVLGGYTDECLSSRCWWWERDGKRAWPRKTVDFLFRLVGDMGHCKRSYENEVAGKQRPPEMRPGV